MNPPRVVASGDSSLVVEFDDCIDVEVNDRVVALAGGVARARIDGVRDIVPAFRTLTVYFDPLKVPSARLGNRLQECLAIVDANSQDVAPAAAKHLVRIPVRYGGAEGPDMGDVAAFAGLSPEDVIALHCASPYRVFMLGFIPGFAYLASVDERIAMPRLDSPRTRVPAGSVGIAGRQTGIYPSATPGGWRLIGRTDVALFDAARRSPFLLKPGDTVQFYAEGGGA